jgi:HlyD family secretion protein
MLKKLIVGFIVLLAAVGVALALIAQPSPKRAPQAATEQGLAAPVTVARVERAHFTETVLVTGSLAAREEVLVGPEVEGFRVVEVLAEEGMRVTKGDVLARLVAGARSSACSKRCRAGAR